MLQRKTNFYFAALSPYESLYLLSRSFWALAGFGGSSRRYRERFEAEWRELSGAAAAIAFPSARAGLYALLRAAGIGRGDEVLVTGFTCQAVPEPILFCGATPAYVDIDPATFAITPAAVAAAITSRTTAVIVQHTFGWPAPVEEIARIARDRGLLVLEDCALALGSRAQGRWLGGVADAAFFSFELSKTLTAGWGGIVQVSRDVQLAERVRAIRDDAGALRGGGAARRLFQAGLSGLLYRPTPARVSGRLIDLLFRIGMFRLSATNAESDEAPRDYAAAPADAQWFALSRQLRRVDRILDAQRRIAETYRSVLDRHGCAAAVPADREGARLIRFPLMVADRERFERAFRRAGVEVGRWFHQPVSCAGGDMSRYGYIRGSCPTAERIGAHIVNLPMHERMSERDVELVVRTLDRYLAEHADERKFIASRLT